MYNGNIYIYILLSVDMCWSDCENFHPCKNGNVQSGGKNMFGPPDSSWTSLYGKSLQLPERKNKPSPTLTRFWFYPAAANGCVKNFWNS